MDCSFEIECLHTSLLLFSGFNKYIKWAARLKLSVSTQVYYCFLAGGYLEI